MVRALHSTNATFVARQPENDVTLMHGSGFISVFLCQYWLAGSRPLFRPTAFKRDVPVVFHEPHIESGFRLLGQPWLYYVFSIFQLHNESLNIWTHVLAFALTAKKLLAFQHEVCF